MRKVTTIVAGAIMAAAGTVAMIVPVSAHAATAQTPASQPAPKPAIAPEDPPCPLGYACIDVIENNGLTFAIQNEWYYYGCYKIYNEYGDRELYNHQTGGAMMRTYKSSDCSGSAYETIPAGHAGEYPITPVNSVLVSPS